MMARGGVGVTERFDVCDNKMPTLMHKPKSENKNRFILENI
jgi:hypothetical protein